MNGGWLGFGIAEAGAMKGADIVYYQSSIPTGVTDAYALDFVAPTRDENQDWTLLSASSEAGWLTVEMTRALDTQVKIYLFNVRPGSITCSSVSCTGPAGHPYRRRLLAFHGWHPYHRGLGVIFIHRLPRPHQPSRQPGSTQKSDGSEVTMA